MDYDYCALSGLIENPANRVNKGTRCCSKLDSKISQTARTKRILIVIIIIITIIIVIIIIIIIMMRSGRGLLNMTQFESSRRLEEAIELEPGVEYSVRVITR